MILIPIAIIIIIIIVRLYKGMFAAFLVFVATKSLLDAFWDYGIEPFSILAIEGFLVPILFFDVFKKRAIVPKYWNRTAKFYLIAMSLGIIWGIFVEPIGVLQNGFLSFNCFLGFFLIPILITDQKRLKQLLLAMMLCGIFPIAVSIFQLSTGIVFQERATVGLSRYVGFYHDAFPTRFYGLMTLISILIYQSVFKVKGILIKGFLLALVGGSFLSIYAVFSKAGVGIVGLWVVLLLLFSKSKIKQSFSVLIGVFVIFLVFGDAVSSNIEQLFSKEVGYQSGELTDARYTLAGRGYIWEDYWNFWTNEQNVFFQWFGDGLARPTHNEVLRVLLMSGILGVLFYVIFIMTQIKNTFKIHKKVRLFGMMLLGMYLVDVIGLVPGLYYYYNILVWGLFGLLLIKPQLFKNIKT
jgi:hypothetical protein